MIRSIVKGGTVVFFSAWLAVFAVDSAAQQNPVEHPWGRSVSIEILKPKLDDYQLTLLSSTIFLSLRLPVSQNALLTVEVPFAQGRIKDGVTSYYGYSRKTETSFGNPYIGWEIRDNHGSAVVDLGIRIPLIKDEYNFARAIGYYSDYYRKTAFFSDILTITLGLNGFKRNKEGFFFKCRIGPEFWMNTERGSGSDRAELLLDYCGQAGFEINRFSVAAGLTGQMLITEGDLDFEERTVHQLGFEACLKAGKIWPSIRLLLPLDKYLKYHLDRVIALNCTFQLQ